MSAAEWGVEQARKKIPIDQASEENKAFYEGDHWQKGAAWTGPMVGPNHAERSTMEALVKRSFVSKNVVGEVVDRHTNGVLGRIPSRTVTVTREVSEDDSLTEEETALIAEAEALLTSWWSGPRGVLHRGDHLSLVTPHEIGQQAAMWPLLTQRSVLRLFVAPAAVQEDEGTDRAFVRFKDPEEAMAQIFCQAIPAEQGAIVVDEDDLSMAGVYVYKRGDHDEAEIVYLDENKQTVWRIVQRDQSKTVSVDLKGRLTMYSVERQPIITETVRRMQKSLNVTKTMSSRNIVAGGALERWILNAQMPGKWVEDASTTTGKRFEPDPIKLGAGVTNFIGGQVIEDENGKKTLASPSVVYRDPVSSQTFIEAERNEYLGILAEVDQLHAAISGDAIASGESRVQAKGDFRASLLPTKAKIDVALSWLCETVLAMAASLSGQAGRYDTLRVSVECQIDTGTLTAGEITNAVTVYEAGLVSRQTTMARLRVENPEDEADLLQAEAEQMLTQLKLKAEIINQLTTAGASIGAAAEIAGLSDEQVTALAAIEVFDDRRIDLDDTGGAGSSATPENIAADKGLNGAQIKAAIDLLERVTLGTMVGQVAVELLLALGIEQERAQRMIDQTESGVSPTDILGVENGTQATR